MINSGFIYNIGVYDRVSVKIDAIFYQENFYFDQAIFIISCNFSEDIQQNKVIFY